MRLDQAMRIGSKMGGQAFGASVRKGGRSCALGAAGLGGEFDLVGVNAHGDILTIPKGVIKQWPALKDDWSICPVDKCPGCRAHSEVVWDCDVCMGDRDYDGNETTDRAHNLRNVIVHLNDFHRWTREAIADWVQLILYPETLDAPAEIVEEPVTETVKA